MADKIDGFSYPDSPTFDENTLKELLGGLMKAAGHPDTDPKTSFNYMPAIAAVILKSPELGTAILKQMIGSGGKIDDGADNGAKNKDLNLLPNARSVNRLRPGQASDIPGAYRNGTRSEPISPNPRDMGLEGYTNILQQILGNTYGSGKS